MTPIRITESPSGDCTGSSWRRELGRHVGGFGLEKRLGPGQTLELMQAEIPEANAGDLRAFNRVAGRAREHYLPTVGCEADPSRSVNGDAHISCVAQSGTPGVQADPDPDPQVVRPDRPENFALNGKRGVQSGGRLLEDREQLVAAGVDL